MEDRIKKVAVMGSGVMGSAIAAHFANVGIPSILMDLPAKDGNDRNAVARAGLASVVKSKPASFYLKDFASLIELGNFDDDLEKIAECDLILEVIIERMDVKKEFFKKIDENRKPGTLVASNTSGLLINEMAADCTEDMRQHFFGMHFFNPPRYLKLLEIIPGRDTLPEVISFMKNFGSDVLGKGIVVCKDTPNFIANRIGMYAIMHAMRTMVEDGYSIQEIDAFTGTNIGHAKSATFRTGDLVGLDTLAHVANNLYEYCPEDDERDMFKTPAFLVKLIKDGALGAKSGKGFFSRTKKKEILHLDHKTGEYVNKEKLSFPSIALARSEDTAAGKIRAMTSAQDGASKFLWKNLSSTLLYCAKRMGEITDSIVDIDNAMQWGFGWEIGPFGTWDILGVNKVAEYLKKEGRELPENISKFLEAGHKTFYKTEKGVEYFYDFNAGDYKERDRGPNVLILKNLKAQEKTVCENSGASLIDLGDGVACLEFHTKMNAIGGEIISFSKKAMEEVEKNFRGLVIANQGAHFCAGANIMMILMSIMEEEWDDIELMIRQFQQMNMRFRYSPRPVVAAPFGMTLGGGCEVSIHSDQIVAAAETYMGLVEVGVGLLPAGGGTKEMLMRAMDKAPKGAVELPFLQKVFETIGMAKVATSGEEARQMGFLTSADKVIVNNDQLIHKAKQAVIGLAESGYTPGTPRTNIPVMGRPGLALIKLMVSGMREGGFISEHDEHIATVIGKVMTGGDISGPQEVSEQYLLDLEREHFLRLCGTRKTQERIKYMLEKGKPLRN
ncbi:MAG: enoyl-CoA hydratase/isomerase family protein [Fibrobacteria bacterium]|nr:enoyl-CoA hydratase/isomerase family protein [Fibrobacteria bacterium]